MSAIKIDPEKFVMRSAILIFYLMCPFFFFQESSDGMYMDRDLCNTLSQLLEPNVSSKSKFDDFHCTKKQVFYVKDFFLRICSRLLNKFYRKTSFSLQYFGSEKVGRGCNHVKNGHMT